jgi:hypothetical protein
LTNLLFTTTLALLVQFCIGNKAGIVSRRKDYTPMTTANVKLREAPPLPADIDDWVRVIKSERNINDLVEDVHRTLVNESEEYRALLRATYDAHAVEGSLAMDNCLASMMIRDYAKKNDIGDVAKEKLAIINLALGVVLRRYKASRKQRRNTVHGEEVSTEGNGE